MTGEDAASRDVLVHQTQDQGIEAVGPGTGRDNHDQHQGVKRLRQIEPIVNSICLIDWLENFEALPPGGGAGDEDTTSRPSEASGAKSPTTTAPPAVNSTNGTHH